MQLARAEGGRLRTATPADVRPVLTMLVSEFTNSSINSANEIDLQLPDEPVVSDVDTDAFSILCRNLIENALRYGTPGSKIDINLEFSGTLHVANDGPIVPAGVLQRLTARFERGNSLGDGSGLGLSIVHTIVSGMDGTLELQSPRNGHKDGFEVTVQLPRMV
jgi:two-component system OmpR family sensor kinase